MPDPITVLFATIIVVGSIVIASIPVFGMILMLRARRARRTTPRRVVAGAVLIYAVVCLFTEANRSLPPLMDVGKSSVTVTDRNRHPLPCIRRYEGTYSDHSGRYVGAYQFIRSTHASVSNARQEAAWPRLSMREQDRAAWRLYELRGLSRWSNVVRRNCR